MAAYNKFNIFVKDMPEKKHNLASDQLTIALTAAANAPVATNAVLADLTQIAYTNLSARNITTSSSSETSGTYKLVLANLTISASGGSSAAFEYFVVYNSTAAGGPLIAWFDYGSALTLASGESVTFTPDGTNGFLQIT